MGRGKRHGCPEGGVIVNAYIRPGREGEWQVPCRICTGCLQTFALQKAESTEEVERQGSIEDQTHSREVLEKLPKERTFANLKETLPKVLKFTELYGVGSKRYFSQITSNLPNKL